MELLVNLGGASLVRGRYFKRVEKEMGYSGGVDFVKIK